MSEKVPLKAWLKAKLIAARRRWALAVHGEFDPYPRTPGEFRLSPSDAHFAAYDQAPLALSWQNAEPDDPDGWQRTARAKLAELTGYRLANAPPAAASLGETDVAEGFARRSYYLRAPEGVDIPVHLIWRPGTEKLADLPVLICLQGTTSGAHISWGGVVMPVDPLKAARGFGFALAAAERGYLAVCPEVSCFGERQERKIRPRSDDPCIDTANHALLLGRTLVGERVSDVSAVISWIVGGGGGFSVDPEKIHILGHSAGGSIAVFAAALDPRITFVIASGCVGFLRATIGRRRDSAGQIVIPGILRWLEMDDVVRMCAPRPFITVSGTADHIWPYAGAAEVVESARGFYSVSGHGDRIQVIEAEGPHTFHARETWAAFDQMRGS